MAYQAWTTSMSEKAEIESWTLHQFTELTKFGFFEPLLKRDGGSTVIDWFGKDIALELELDWKEFDVFFLIVRLENDRLPQGYYVSNGKPCRFHLQKVIKEKMWSVDTNAMKVINTNEKNGRLQKPSAENLKKRIVAYQALLISCIDQVVADGVTIFNP